MLFYADTHTHTLASTHAYSTVLENAQYASQKGIGCIAVTDHAPKMLDAPHIWHFRNIKTVPAELFGVKILRGAEANLMKDGSIDLEGSDLANLEWVVVSLHPPVFGEFSSAQEVTNAYIEAAKNPYIDVIGHSGSFDYPYDFEKAVKAFAKYEKLVEINEHTFDVRSKSIENCKKIAELCRDYNVGVVINSDAHFAYDIGTVERSLSMLNSIGFKEENIINMKKETFDAYLKKREKRIEKVREKDLA